MYIDYDYRSSLEIENFEVNCNGLYSCTGTHFDTYVIDIRCSSFKSCDNVDFSTDKIFGEFYGPFAFSNSDLVFSVTLCCDLSRPPRPGTYIHATGSFVMMNDIIHIDTNFSMTIEGDFALYNVTIVCDGWIGECTIDCIDENSYQWLVLPETDLSCGFFESFEDLCDISENCIFFESIDDDDIPIDVKNNTKNALNQTMDMYNEFMSICNIECEHDGTYDDNRMPFDIGYPLYGGSVVANDVYGGTICVVDMNHALIQEHYIQI